MTAEAASALSGCLGGFSVSGGFAASAFVFGFKSRRFRRNLRTFQIDLTVASVWRFRPFEDRSQIVRVFGGCLQPRFDPVDEVRDAVGTRKPQLHGELATWRSACRRQSQAATALTHPGDIARYSCRCHRGTILWNVEIAAM